MRNPLRRALPLVLLPVLLACCGCVQAQLGGSVVLESDNRFRGISLNNEQPDLRLSLAYDHTSGAYAGVSFSGAEFEPGQRHVQGLLYGGFSAAIDTGRRWELGATYARVPGDSRYDYGEAYAGLLAERWSLRLYLAPDYFGSGQRTAYAELDSSGPLAAGWRWFAHAGGLQGLDGSGHRVDGRLGIGLRAGEIDLQAAWVGTQRGGGFRRPYDERRNTVVFSAAVSF